MASPIPTPSPSPMYVSPTSVIFYWSPPSDGSLVTNYRFSIPNTLTVVLPSTQTSYQVSDLQHGIPITPTIESSSDNESTWSEPASFPTFTPIIPPSHPPKSATASAVSPGVVEISWVAPDILPEGKAYYLVNSVSSTIHDPVIGFASSDLNTISCTLSEFNPESSYMFKVSIVNQVGSSGTIDTNSVSF